MARDIESAPITGAWRIDAVICGLADDLDALRAGTISIADASARAALAKQIFNGARLAINARRTFEGAARSIEAPEGKLCEAADA